MHKKLLLAFFVVITGALSTSAQKIEMEKAFGGYRFQKEGNVLSLRQLEVYMKTNKEAFALFKSGKSKQDGSILFGVLGGGLIGWPVGTLIGGGEPNWILAGIGVGSTVISMSFSSAANKKLKSAVEVYNAGISSTSRYYFKPEYKLALGGNGFGAIISF